MKLFKIKKRFNFEKILESFDKYKNDYELKLENNDGKIKYTINQKKAKASKKKAVE